MIKICFLILPNTNLFDIAAASQVFHEATEKGVDLQLEYCSFEKNIYTSFKLPLGRLKNFRAQKLKKGDYLFISSADINYILSKEFRPEQALLDWIKNMHSNGVTICAICNAAFLLARTGLLDGRSCTTHWNRTKQLQKMFPKAKVVENILFTEDTGVYTSAGASTSIDIALHIVSELKSENVSYKISRELVLYNRRAGSQAQESIFLDYRNHMHHGVHKVQDWLQEHMDKKTSLSSLAELAFMSSRNLTRIFKTESGLTINEYLTLLRKERIKELSKNPDLSRKQIAGLCGLKSERQVIRLIRQ